MNFAWDFPTVAPAWLKFVLEFENVPLCLVPDTRWAQVTRAL